MTLRLTRRRGRSIVAILLVAALGGAAAVVLTKWSGGTSKMGGPPAPKLRSFIDRTENLLEQLAAGRYEVRASLTAGFNCSISPREAGQRITSVTVNRQSILRQLDNLKSPTQGADTVLLHLQQALRRTIQADRQYRDGFFTIALAPTSVCPLPANPNFTVATRSNARAIAAKELFVATFNPIAMRFHRRTWSVGEF